MRRFLVGAALVFVSACSVELEHGLDEREANHIVALLDEQGLSAEKAQDEATAAWKVVLPRAELGRAFRVLESYDLPRRGRRGLGEVLAERSLVPSLAEEAARLESARAVELERTLERVPGVVSARVHLSLGDATRLEGPAIPPKAAVLIRSQGTPAITEGQVRTLVAGATAGLRPEAVEVVMSGGAAPPPSTLEPAGPIRVARGERGRVVAIAASGLALLVVLGAALVLTALRLAGLRSAALADQSADAAAASKRSG